MADYDTKKLVERVLGVICNFCTLVTCEELTESISLLYYFSVSIIIF